MEHRMLEDVILTREEAEAFGVDFNREILNDEDFLEPEELEKEEFEHE